MSRVNFIGYACGEGAADKRCEKGPAALKKLDLEGSLEKLDIDAYWGELVESPISDLPDGEDPENKLSRIVDYCTILSEQVAEAVKTDFIPVTLGGDHTMAIGTWGGLTQAMAAKGQFGLIWIDAHLDAHTPSTSVTGNFHGMPLATLLGYGHPRLSAIGGGGPKISPEHLAVIGVRSYEPAEEALLKSLGVRIFYMDEVKERGFDAVFKDALDIVEKAEKGFGISLDVDAFDPEVAPGTGTTAENGLQKEEVFKALSGIGTKPDFKALEVAEYNPALDRDEMTAELICELLEVVFSKRM